MKNIGIGIVTCNRQDFYNKCLASIPEDYFAVTINDGEPIKEPIRKNHVFIQNKQNQGVGKSKNILFKNLLER